MILWYGFVFFFFLVTSCQSLTLLQPQEVELEVQSEFQRAALFLKQQEYEKAARTYNRITQEYPQHPRAEEAAILGQELQRLVSLTESLTLSKEIALKDLRKMTQKFKQLSDKNAKLEKFAKENARLRSELRRMEERLARLEEENQRFRSDIGQLKESFKEFQEIEQEMKQPTELPVQSEEDRP